MNEEQVDLSCCERTFIGTFIDTDGCITMSIVYNTTSHRGWIPIVTVTFTNTKTPILDKVQIICGTKLKYAQTSSGVYHLRYRHRILRWLLPQLSLVLKEDKRLAAIDIVNILNKQGRRNVRRGSGYEEELLKLTNIFRKLQQKEKIGVNGYVK